MLPRWLIHFRALALACAFAAAFVPIATYITDDKRDWLWIHIGVNIAAYIAVALTTIYTTVNLTQQDHNKFSVPAYWANNVVMRTWYLGVSKTWRWHVAAAVGRLGLALAQHVHITFGNPPNFPHILNQFRYYDYNLYPYKVDINVTSQWETILVGLIVLCNFAMLEMALLTSWTLLVRYVWPAKNRGLILGVVLMRIGLIIFFISIMVFMQEIIRTENVGKIDSPQKAAYQWYDERIYTRSYRERFKEWHKIAFTWLDNGVMLTTWIMRPMMPTSWNYACIERGENEECLQYNNRLWVLSDVLAALVAYTTYILAIIASLQLAQYLRWRREQTLTTTPSSTP